MAFESDFATSLGEGLGVEVDESSFGTVDDTSAQISALQEFLGSLDSVSLQTLDAVTEAGIDPSSAVSEDGSAADLPGGALLGLAATAGTSLSTVVSTAQSSYEVALADNPTDTDEPVV